MSEIERCERCGRWVDDIQPHTPQCQELEIAILRAEVARWKSEYDDVAKFATQYEHERDQLRIEMKRHEEAVVRHLHISMENILTDTRRTKDELIAECNQLQDKVQRMLVPNNVRRTIEIMCKAEHDIGVERMVEHVVAWLNGLDAITNEYEHCVGKDIDII